MKGASWDADVRIAWKEQAVSLNSEPTCFDSVS